MTIDIVIPAFNEESRIQRTIFTLIWQQHNLPHIGNIFVVDDGSTDATASLARAIFGVTVLSLAKNSGKGAAVTRGLKEAKSEWVLMADADMATAWNEIRKLTPYCSRADIIVGSRALAGSRVFRVSYSRKLLGSSFNLLTRLLTGLHIQDTQCGFKLMRRSTLSFLDELRVKGFAWDVEFLYKAMNKGLRIVEVPVQWKHQEGSKVKVLRDGGIMLFELIRIILRK